MIASKILYEGTTKGLERSSRNQIVLREPRKARKTQKFKPQNTLNTLKMPRRRRRQNQKNFGVHMKSKEERVPTAACGSAVRHASRKRKQRHAEA